MRLPVLVSYLLLALQAVLAAAPAEYARVLVVVDESDADVDARVLAEPLRERGFDVRTSGLKDRPTLLAYGERSVDNVIIVPGKTKALGSSLKAADLLEFMRQGGNVVALTTAKHSPAALRELAAQLGIEVSGRGVEARNPFGHAARAPNPAVLPASGDLGALFDGAAVAKIDSANPYALGFVQAPYSAYAYNAAKDSADGDAASEPARPLSDAFGLGGELFLSAGLQSLHNARFVWVGSAQLLADPAHAAALTGWAFHEQRELRLAGVTHASRLTNESHRHYKVEEPLRYCAQIEEWSAQEGRWRAYADVADVQVEFKMLDPYYRLNLGADGCVDFTTPEQYGMFTFALDYKRPGLAFLDDQTVVTVRHRANDEWDRSWTITNSWVYLSGVSTTVIGFVVFVALFLSLPAPSAAAGEAAAEKPSKAAAAGATTGHAAGTASGAVTGGAASAPVAVEESKKPRRRQKN